MEGNFFEKKIAESFLAKYKFPLLISSVVFVIIAVAFFISFKPQKESLITNPDFIYNTWKVEKIYKNGKLVINSNRYNNLFFQVNRDGSAEWIKGDKRLELNFVISQDGSQIILDDGMRMEDVQTVFELRPNVLRFGRKGINSHYEYVFTAVNVKDGNFF